MGKLRQLFASRRWYASIIGIGQVILGSAIGLTPDQSALIIGGIAAWVLGDSISKTGDQG